MAPEYANMRQDELAKEQTNLLQEGMQQIEQWNATAVAKLDTMLRAPASKAVANSMHELHTEMKKHEQSDALQEVYQYNVAKLKANIQRHAIRADPELNKQYKRAKRDERLKREQEEAKYVEAQFCCTNDVEQGWRKW